MSPPAHGQPRPGVGMPEVAASTAFSRRGCTPWFPSPADHAGEIYISFHEHGPFPDPEAAWQEQIATHLAPLPGRYIYPPSNTGQYDLRLRSQLMPPPACTVFLLIPVAPLAPDDPSRARDVPLHRLVTSLQLLSHAYVGFVSSSPSLKRFSTPIKRHGTPPPFVQCGRICGPYGSATSPRLTPAPCMGLMATARPVAIRHPWG